jgi:hypothetical protein
VKPVLTTREAVPRTVYWKAQVRGSPKCTILATHGYLLSTKWSMLLLLLLLALSPGRGSALSVLTRQRLDLLSRGAC